MPWGTVNNFASHIPLQKRPGNSAKWRFSCACGHFGAKKRLRQSDIMIIWPHCALLRTCTSPSPSDKCFRAFWPFSFYGHPDLKKDWFFDIWALFTRKMASETVIFAPNGLHMHFWVVSHPTGTSGKCFRASWPYFELLTPPRLKIDRFFDIWALFECQNTDS